VSSLRIFFIEQGDGVRLRQHLWRGPHPHPQHAGRHGGHGGGPRRRDGRGYAQRRRDQHVRGVHEQRRWDEYLKRNDNNKFRQIKIICLN